MTPNVRAAFEWLRNNRYLKGPTMSNDPNIAFTLRLKLYNPNHDRRVLVVHVFDHLGWDDAGRVKLTYEVRHGGKVIFPMGQLYGAVHGPSDGARAKEHVLSHIAMYPGDGSGVGEDFYEGYTPEQLKWVTTYGEAINIERSDRYCNPEDGSVKE